MSDTHGGIKLLIVEDSVTTAQIVMQSLRDSTLAEFEVVHVDHLEAALKSLEQDYFDLVMLDLGLPDSHGLEGLAKVRERALGTPVIVVTAIDNDATGVQAVRDGAEEYLVKDVTARHHLARTFVNVLTRSRREGLDGLTGLINRRGFTPLANRQLRIAQGKGLPLTLLFIDVDDMKGINDNHGHLEGDRALTDLGAILSRVFRESDLKVRMGGDEFCVLATGKEARIALNRLEEAIQLHNFNSARPYHLSVSAGAYIYEPDGPDSLSRLLELADARMYEHKRQRQRAAAGQSSRRGPAKTVTLSQRGG